MLCCLVIGRKFSLSWKHWKFGCRNRTWSCGNSRWKHTRLIHVPNQGLTTKEGFSLSSSTVQEDFRQDCTLAMNLWSHLKIVEVPLLGQPIKAVSKCDKSPSSCLKMDLTNSWLHTQPDAGSQSCKDLHKLMWFWIFSNPGRLLVEGLVTAFAEQKIGRVGRFGTRGSCATEMRLRLWLKVWLQNASSSYIQWVLSTFQKETLDVGELFKCDADGYG